jgi:antitoxin component YwqK of YwqJK toxin-antitoxin module
MKPTIFHRFLLSNLLMFIFINISLSQNLTDQQGRKQGKWVKNYNYGSMRYEGMFLDDKPVGEFKYYYKDSSLKAITIYSASGDSAATKSFHKNGKTMAEGIYFKQQKEGKWLYYSDVDEALISEENYKNGQLHGKLITFYPESGKPAEILEYREGKREGPLLKFFPEGSTMTEGTYVNDSLDGKFTLYWPDGKIQVSGAYDHGMQSGDWTYYDEEGNPVSEGDFRFEVLENDTIEFDFPPKTD